MNKEFTPYQESLALKELGFDEPCIMAYFKYTTSEPKNRIQLLRPLDRIYGENYFFNNSSEEFKDTSISGDGDGAKCSAPTFSQAFRFFREKYKIEPEMLSDMMGYVCSIVDRNKPLKTRLTPSNLFQTYEEAELACLKKLIEIVKK